MTWDARRPDFCLQHGSNTAHGADPGEEGGGGLVGRVLGHQLAGEGLLQNRLPQRLGFLEVGVDVFFRTLNQRNRLFKNSDDFCLLWD